MCSTLPRKRARLFGRRKARISHVVSLKSNTPTRWTSTADPNLAVKQDMRRQPDSDNRHRGCRLDLSPHRYRNKRPPLLIADVSGDCPELNPSWLVICGRGHRLSKSTKRPKDQQGQGCVQKWPQRDAAPARFEARGEPAPQRARSPALYASMRLSRLVKWSIPSLVAMPFATTATSR
jgi:hypothetical protein